MANRDGLSTGVSVAPKTATAAIYDFAIGAYSPQNPEALDYHHQTEVGPDYSIHSVGIEYKAHIVEALAIRIGKIATVSVIASGPDTFDTWYVNLLSNGRVTAYTNANGIPDRSSSSAIDSHEARFDIEMDWTRDANYQAALARLATVADIIYEP